MNYSWRIVMAKKKYASNYIEKKRYIRDLEEAGDTRSVAQKKTDDEVDQVFAKEDPPVPGVINQDKPSWLDRIFED